MRQYSGTLPRDEPGAEAYANCIESRRDWADGEWVGSITSQYDRAGQVVAQVLNRANYPTAYNRWLYDVQARSVTIERYDPADGTVSTRWVRVYDDSDRLTSYYYYSGSPLELVSAEDYTYEVTLGAMDGYVTERMTNTVSDRDGARVIVVEELDKRWGATYERRRDRHGDGVWNEFLYFTLSEDGVIQQLHWDRNGDGTVNLVYVLGYDEVGREVRVNWSVVAGAPPYGEEWVTSFLADGWSWSRDVFDRHGNWIVTYDQRLDDLGRPLRFERRHYFYGHYLETVDIRCAGELMHSRQPVDSRAASYPPARNDDARLDALLTPPRRAIDRWTGAWGQAAGLVPPLHAQTQPRTELTPWPASAWHGDGPQEYVPWSGSNADWSAAGGHNRDGTGRYLHTP